MALSFQLFDVVYREETLLNVMKSVTRNGKSIMLTAVLAIILVYLFSIVGFIFFKDDFLLDADIPDVRPALPSSEDNETCDADGGCPEVELPPMEPQLDTSKVCMGKKA